MAESDERIRELNRQVAARADGPPAGPNARRDFGGPPGPRGDLLALMDEPEMQRLRAVQQKAALDGRFAALFKQLKLPAASLEKLKDLLVEKEITMQDMMSVAREHGIDPRLDPAGFRDLVTSAQNETDSAIKSLLGDSDFTQYQQYQLTLPQRAVVSQLQQSLSYTSEPLSDTQAASLLQILASDSAQSTSASDGPGPMLFGPGPGAGPSPIGGGPGSGPRAVITAETVALSQTVLSATQLQVLQQLQAAQQAQDQMARTFRENFGPGPRVGDSR